MKPRAMYWRMIAWILLPVVSTVLMASSVAMAQEKVAYRLKWLINASTAGDVFARGQGFFSKESLDVTVKAGGPERDAIRELELGYAQFGVASADQVMRALAKGASVVVLAQLFQINPLQWIYRADHFSLDRIQDLAGKTVGITYGGNDETIMRALLATAGLDEHKVHLASVRYDYTPFFQKKIPIYLAGLSQYPGHLFDRPAGSRRGAGGVLRSVRIRNSIRGQQCGDLTTHDRSTSADGRPVHPGTAGRLAGGHGAGQRSRGHPVGRRTRS